jgi:metal-responsive CopG/Arc/MetJ family transcriptional regulator
MKSSAFERINITLPSQTLAMIDGVAEQGSRSRLIDVAVHFYLNNQKRLQVQKEMKEPTIARASRDRALVRELFDFTDTWEKDLQ